MRSWRLHTRSAPTHVPRAWASAWLPRLLPQCALVHAPPPPCAGVYFEKYVKGRHAASLWVRNIQLGLFGVPLRCAPGFGAWKCAGCPVFLAVQERPELRGARQMEGSVKRGGCAAQLCSGSAVCSQSWQAGRRSCPEQHQLSCPLPSLRHSCRRPCSTAYALLKDGWQIHTGGLMQGFDAATWMVIALQASRLARAPSQPHRAACVRSGRPGQLCVPLSDPASSSLLEHANADKPTLVRPCTPIPPALQVFGGLVTGMVRAGETLLMQCTQPLSTCTSMPSDDAWSAAVHALPSVAPAWPLVSHMNPPWPPSPCPPLTHRSSSTATTS